MILKFFNKENSLDNDTDLLNVACLMIHAAKIDENYTDKEKKIIKETLTKLSNNEDLDKLISEAETKEADSNHIQDFTKIIKAMDKNDKIEIISSGNTKGDKIELVPKMLNLLGCSKENFLKLIKKMNYNVSLENDKYFFKYSPSKKTNKLTKNKFQSDNPFAALKQLNIK